MTLPARFSMVRKSMHWVTAVLILGLAMTGMAYSNDIGGSVPLMAHQILGQILILVLIVRLIGVLRSPAGPNLANHAVWERRVSKMVHVLLYLCMIFFVATGFVAASGLREPSLLYSLPLTFARSDMAETLVEIHYALKIPLIALLFFHVGGALKHALVDKDETLQDMWFTK